MAKLFSVCFALWGIMLAVPALADNEQTSAAASGGNVPIIIAHRGASGARPEHTASAYQLAIQQGADFIEPDLVMTRDGHLVARHDIYLSSTTNIADLPEFANRKRTLEGKCDWYAFDFTLAELKRLKTRQPRSGRSNAFDGIETIPTVAEVILLVKNANIKNNSKTGIYIEIKRPTLHKAMGLDPTDALRAVFSQLEKDRIPAYFQCFDADYLRSFPTMAGAPKVFLIEGEHDPDTGRYKAAYEMDKWAREFEGLGLNKALLVSDPAQPGQVVRDAHNAGLKVHIWTIRDDVVPPAFKTGTEELQAIFSLGVDGVFTDHPDVAISARAVLGAR